MVKNTKKNPYNIAVKVDEKKMLESVVIMLAKSKKKMAGGYTCFYSMWHWTSVLFVAAAIVVSFKYATVFFFATLCYFVQGFLCHVSLRKNLG